MSARAYAIMPHGDYARAYAIMPQATTGSKSSSCSKIRHVIATFIYAIILTFLTFLDHLLVQGRPVFESSSIFGLVPCLQSVGISSCLPVCCPSISFSVGLGSFSQGPLVLAILHRCGWVLASSSGQTTLVFCFPGKFQQVLRGPPS